MYVFSTLRICIYIYTYVCQIVRCKKMLGVNQPPLVLAASVAVVLPFIDCLISPNKP